MKSKNRWTANSPIVASAVFIVAASCTCLQADERSAMSNNEPSELLSIKVTCKTDKENLYVTYKERNEADFALLCYDGYFDPESDWKEPTEQEAIFYKNDDTLEIKRMRLPLSDEEDVTFTVIPAVFKLEPGQERDIRLRLPLPVAEQHPSYPMFAGARKKQTIAKKIAVYVGFMKFDRKMTLKPFDVPQTFRVRSGYSKQLLSWGSCECEVNVEARIDGSFKRF